jgi:hypothetical protein
MWNNLAIAEIALIRAAMPGKICGERTESRCAPHKKNTDEVEFTDES